jgi:hypothetical protein
MLRSHLDASASNAQVTTSNEHLSNRSSTSSSRSADDGNNGRLNFLAQHVNGERVHRTNDLFCFLVYIETLLYIVHVDDIDLPLSTDVTTEEMYDGGDEQASISSNKLVRHLSKRTTASFNERHQRTVPTAHVPIYARPSLGFSNPLRRLNSNRSLDR